MKKQLLPDREKMLRDKRLAQGCHEASHAVIALTVKHNFKCIQLGKSEPSSIPRYLEGDAVVSMGRMIPTDETVYREGALKEAMIHLAGIAFEKLLRPHHSFLVLLLSGPAGDYHQALEWCIYGLGGPPNATREEFPQLAEQAENLIFKHLLPKVRELVADNWKKIAAVGSELAKSGELSRRQVINITRKHH